MNPYEECPWDNTPDWGEMGAKCPKCGNDILEESGTNQRAGTVGLHCEDCGHEWQHTMHPESDPFDSIVALVKNIAENAWKFYRALYKGTACGPMVGFRIDGEWVYGQDLPDKTPIEKLDLSGVRVSSIVEGSDVEIDGKIFDAPFKPDEFWKAVKAVNDEASFYWVRDNSVWYHVWDSAGEYDAWCHIEGFDDAVKWDDAGKMPPALRNDLSAAIMKHADEIPMEKPFPYTIPGMGSDCFFIQEFENDTTYL